jgi:hypothetical protein
MMLQCYLIARAEVHNEQMINVYEVDSSVTVVVHSVEELEKETAKIKSKGEKK